MVIGFFMPLPLAMMIPFMGIQSMVMAKQFGENFQYGKRRISAMSNDDFNKLTPAKLLSNANDELKSQIPLMKQSMEDMRQFQTFIVKEFLLTIRSIIDAGLGKLIGLTPTEINQTVQNIEHFLHGHFEGHGEVPEPPPTNEEDPTNVTDKLDPSFQTVKNWTSTKLNLVHANQLHLYTAKAQGFIHSVHDFNKNDDDDEGIPINQLKPKGTFVFLSSKYPLIHALILKSLNHSVKIKKWTDVYNTLRTQLSAATFRLTNAKNASRPSPTQIDLFTRQKLEIQNMIIDFNKFISTSGIKV